MLNTILQLLFFLSSPSSTVQLVDAVQAQAPTYLTREQAWLHVLAAKMGETKEAPAELLLGMARTESNFQTKATSRIQDGKRTVGIPSWSTPPANVTGPFFCGVTQATAEQSWARCLELRNIFTAYATTAFELAKWNKVCSGTAERMQCILFGYGGGFPAIKAKTSTYPARVLYRTRLLKKATTPLT